MAGPINNHGGLGLNGSRAGSVPTPGTERNVSDKATDAGGQAAAKVATDEVSLSAAAKQLNAQESSASRGAASKIETPDQALAMAKQIAAAIKQDGAHALAALGGGDVAGMKGLLISA